MCHLNLKTEIKKYKHITYTELKMEIYFFCIDIYIEYKGVNKK